ncbi:MAG: hypothetical protein ACYDC1_11150, partial [Limisphaerales bacterium]
KTRPLHSSWVAQATGLGRPATGRTNRETGAEGDLHRLSCRDQTPDRRAARATRFSEKCSG